MSMLRSEGERYGSLQLYDKTIDRVSARNEKPLLQGHGVYYRVSTTQDPVIEKLAKQGVGNIFGTDILIAALMASTRSVYSWDIVVHRIADKLFFDRRDSTGWVLAPDAITVSETANEPPTDETGMNSPKMLAQEAVYINQNFRQQVLRQDDGAQRINFDHPNVPFADDDDRHLSIAYKYRRFNLGTGEDGKDRILVVRCEHDGYMVGPGGDQQLLTIKAFNEWDSKQSGGVDWRKTLDQQKGAVLATELKNNSFRLAKWTLQALMANSHQVKFGYVSRQSVKDSARHVILATEHFAPEEFAHTTGLDIANCWGVLRCLVDYCLAQPAGKYLLMKDPNKGALRMYKLPQNEFESDQSSGSEDADDEDADVAADA